MTSQQVHRSYQRLPGICGFRVTNGVSAGTLLGMASIQVRPLSGGRASYRLAYRLHGKQQILTFEDPDEASQSLPLIEELDATLKPLLQDLQGAVPDIGEILAVITRLEPVVTDVETRIAGLPGAGRLRRRGQREIEAAATGNTSAQ